MKRSDGMRGGSASTRWALGIALVVVLGVGVGAVATRSADPGPSSTPVRGSPSMEASLSGVPATGTGAAHAGAAAEGAERAEIVPGASEAAGGVAPRAPVEVPPEDLAADVAEGPTDDAAVEPPVEWASPRSPSPVEPVPAESRVSKPEAVRGIYVGAWSVGSRARFEQLIQLAVDTEVNAFVIDVKDVSGQVSYRSEVPLAEQLGATSQPKIGDIRAALDRLREHGIYPIARIVVFKDPLLASMRPEWSIEREDGTIWEDNNGVHWVDSYNRNVWDYNIELAREAIALGFSEIQWDYVRFPDVPSSYLVEAVYPAREGRSKTDAIREFMTYARERLGDLDVPLTADVFGITTSTRRDIGIGQVWEKLADVVDVLLPMVYPSHYPRGSWDYQNPNAAPYQIVNRAMKDGIERSLLIDGAASIRPWLQAFTLGEPEYGARHIRAQIDAVYDAGLTEWVLWSPNVRYPREAFATAAGEEPWFAGMGEMLYEERPPAAPVDTVSEPLGEPIG